MFFCGPDQEGAEHEPLSAELEGSGHDLSQTSANTHKATTSIMKLTHSIGNLMNKTKS